MPRNHSFISKIGDYSIVREMNRNREGGRITYLASDDSKDAPVIIKQFRFVQENSSWSGFKSYEQEIAILKSIHHPRVPSYLDSFETDDGFCMVQEYKDAPTLAQKKHLMPDQVQKIAINLLRVLADLQNQSPPIIHRDIKPENILVDRSLDVFLIDFGLAKLNHESVAISSVAAGTPGFMPPEEIFNRPLGTSADLYSVGASIIALLSNKPSSEIAELIDDDYKFQVRQHLPELNSQFIEWLIKMVEPNPKDRFPNAQQALNVLLSLDINDLSNQSVSPIASNTSSKGLKNIGLYGLMGILLFTIANGWFSNNSTSNVSPPEKQSSPAVQWFEANKNQCNSLEVITSIKNKPYPQTAEGYGYGASCYALAGKIDLAKQTLERAPKSEQAYAASILFQIGHPVADRGDDESAGPIMDLVLEYWPENYMARYHAGMSAYILEEQQKATDHLNIFLQQYQNNDGWTAKAKLAISNIEKNIPADERFKIHH